eukprot:s1465_g3.t1
MVHSYVVGNVDMFKLRNSKTKDFFNLDDCGGPDCALALEQNLTFVLELVATLAGADPWPPHKKFKAVQNLAGEAGPEAVLQNPIDKKKVVEVPSEAAKAVASEAVTKAAVGFEKTPLLPSSMNLDASLEEQALQLSSNLLKEGGTGDDLAKAEAKVLAAARGEKRPNEDQDGSIIKKVRAKGKAKAKGKASAKTKVTQPASAQSGEDGVHVPVHQPGDDEQPGEGIAPSGEGEGDKPAPERKP